MRKDHPLAKGPLTIKRYTQAHHLLVSFSGRPFGFVDEALASLGHKRRIVLTVNQFFTAGRVVATSDLLSVLPRHFVSVTGMADEFVMRELPFEVSPVHVDSLWHRRQGQRSDHSWLRLAVAAASQKAFGLPGR
jgi:DNA-binding transcriptional LysR family regulator